MVDRPFNGEPHAVIALVRECTTSLKAGIAFYVELVEDRSEEIPAIPCVSIFGEPSDVVVHLCRDRHVASLRGMSECCEDPAKEPSCRRYQGNMVQDPGQNLKIVASIAHGGQ